MANKNRVAVLKTASLTELLGEELLVMKSGREGARYPLYISSKIGPIHLNTAAAQNFVLENGVFDGANTVITSEKEVLDELVKTDEKKVLDNPVTVKSAGFLDRIFTLDE